MRCSVAGGKVRNRNWEVAKLGYHGGSCGFNYGVEVSPFASPTRSVACQEEATGIIADRQMRDDVRVAQDAARHPLDKTQEQQRLVPCRRSNQRHGQSRHGPVRFQYDQRKWSRGRKPQPC